jgi:hypothetical protein
MNLAPLRDPFVCPIVVHKHNHFFIAKRLHRVPELIPRGLVRAIERAKMLFEWITVKREPLANDEVLLNQTLEF